jgi:hypothetical protein
MGQRMAVSLVASVSTDFTGAGDTLGGAAVLLLVAALGVSVRYRDTARAQLVEQAKPQEREQLAMELHDTRCPPRLRDSDPSPGRTVPRTVLVAHRGS